MIRARDTALGFVALVVAGIFGFLGRNRVRSDGTPDPSEVQGKAPLSVPVVLPRRDPRGEEKPTVAKEGEEMHSFQLEHDLPEHTWESYRAKSLEELSDIQVTMDRQFQTLKQSTDALTARRSQLLAMGQSDEADRLLANEIQPAFEARNRIVAEAILIARAKAERRSERLLAKLPSK